MSQRRITRRKLRASQGFTLVELMITVAVMVVLAAIAAPSMSAMIDNSRTAGQTEELVSTLQMARAEAIRRNARVTVCGGTGGACSGTTTWANWTIFGRDNTLAVPADDVIRDTTAGTGMVVTSSVDRIIYKPSGMIDTQQKLGVTKSGNQRCITVLISGVVTVSNGAC